jgi:hypothetical protein
VRSGGRLWTRRVSVLRTGRRPAWSGRRGVRVRPTFPRPLGGARERRLATANEYLDRATPAHLVIGIRRTRRRSVGVGIAKIHTIVAAFGGVPRMGHRLVVISVAYRDRSRAVGSGWPCRDIHGPFSATLIRGAPCARTNRAASVLHRSPPRWGGAAPLPNRWSRRLCRSNAALVADGPEGQARGSSSQCDRTLR